MKLLVEFLFVLVVTSSNGDHHQKSPCESVSVEEFNKSQDAYNEFALKFFLNVSASQPDKNVVVSPLSVALALALLENAASGSTRDKIKDLLIGRGSNGNVLSAYRALEQELKTKDNGTELTIANGLFIENKFEIKQEFITNSKKCLQSEVVKKNFKNQLEQTRKDINQWVSSKTSNKIPELFKEGVLQEDVVLVLANAIYFKSTWKYSFPLETTRAGSFYKFGKKENQSVPFMSNKAEYGHSADDDSELLILPYSNPDYSFYIILPLERDGLARVENNLTLQKIKNLKKTLIQEDIALDLPRFTARSPVDLKDSLSALGLADVFNSRADFARASDAPLTVSSAKHEAFIEVNENGTEASGATGIGQGWRSAPTYVAVDHPFLYALVHGPTNAIVFIGKITSIDEK